VKWLGFDWNGEPRYASGYFDQLYTWAVQLINKAMLMSICKRLKKLDLIAVTL
jgi:hypothetical protein